ncbi:MAG: hypothetical protein JXA51_06155 [Dehalococcoidales bacterium]|nr:hypothetical protein [Dehalococcoidales bacterium]
MNKQYEHTQVGYLIIIPVVVAMILIGIILANTGISWIAVGVLVLIAVALVLFSSLTVVIREEELEVRFGPGAVRKRFRLDEIESVKTLKNPWYYGWGIRTTPHGLLFRVSGLHAVHIKLINGKQYQIGTDVPRELEQAIRQAINSR